MSDDLRPPSSFEGSTGIENDAATDRSHRRVASKDIPVVKLCGGGLFEAEMNVRFPARAQLFAIQHNDPGKDLGRAQMESDAGPVPQRLGGVGE